VTPRGHENKRLPLRTQTSSRMTSHSFPIPLLAPKERERKLGRKNKKRKD
jgi:hypothetical protein